MSTSKSQWGYVLPPHSTHQSRHRLRLVLVVLLVVALFSWTFFFLAATSYGIKRPAVVCGSTMYTRYVLKLVFSYFFRYDLSTNILVAVNKNQFFSGSFTCYLLLISSTVFLILRMCFLLFLSYLTPKNLLKVMPLLRVLTELNRQLIRWHWSYLVRFLRATLPCIAMETSTFGDTSSLPVLSW